MLQYKQRRYHMKPARCPNCGADIMVNELNSTVVCDFCNTPLNTQNAINQINNPSVYSQSMTNNYCNTMFQSKYKSSNTKKTSNHIQLIKPKHKPKLNIPLTIVLFLLLIFPGIIYVTSIKKKQEKWNKNNRNFK